MLKHIIVCSLVLCSLTLSVDAEQRTGNNYRSIGSNSV